jgi:hypothetical protein
LICCQKILRENFVFVKINFFKCDQDYPEYPLLLNFC